MSDLFSIKDKVALVTGGSRGIGLMIARGYVEAGAKVYISSRKQDVCDQVGRRAVAGRHVHLACRPTAGRRRAARRWRGRSAEREPALHILVNNAGANWGAPLAEYPDAAWDKVLALNVKAVFHLTRACLPMLRAAATAGRSGARHQHRLDRRPARAGAGDLRLLVEQGGGAPPDARAGHPAGARPHHGQRRGARPVREQDDARDARALPRRHRGHAARWVASASRRTWRAWRSTWRRARAPT